jgi:hypothetical protein
MSSESIPVAIAFGNYASTELESLARRMHVWVVGTPQNRTAAEAFWQKSPGAPPSEAGITTFTSGPNVEPLERLPSLLDTVEQHHPALSRIELYGIERSAAVLAVLAAFGFSSIASVSGGFRACRVVT